MTKVFVRCFMKMEQIQLSKHFKLNEFLRSETAVRRGIDNTPSIEVVSNLQQLCVNILEPLRAYFNGSWTIVSSTN